jgi:hypothetical protein
MRVFPAARTMLTMTRFTDGTAIELYSENKSFTPLILGKDEGGGKNVNGSDVG